MGERDRDAAPESAGNAPVQPAEASPAPPIDSLLRGDLRHAVRSGGPTDPELTAQLRRLQRSAGNAAVMRMLRQVAPPAAEAAPAPAGLIVDDEGAEATAGQMRARAFLDEAHKRAGAAATRELGLLFTVAGCPWLDHWIDYYRGRSASQIEAAIRRYAPAAAGATTAAQYLAAVEQRVVDGITAWRETGELPAAPTESAAPTGGGAPASVARMPSLLDEPGTPLDPTVASQVGSAFGRDFASVRIHAGTPAAALTGRLASRAVTVGRHVAFAPGEYEPGTPLGNALIAHELAHVVQQEGGGVARSPATVALETDADAAAKSALLASYVPQAGLGRRVVPALRTGLTLQSCPGEKATAATFDQMIAAAEFGHAATMLSAETDDAEILKMLQPLTPMELDKLDVAAKQELGPAADRLHRPIGFLRHGPEPGTPHADVTVGNPGVENVSDAVGGGTVKARTGVEARTGGGRSADDAFSIGYRGADADKSHWLQFVWREVIADGHPRKGTYRVDEAFDTASTRPYRLTVDPAKPRYNTDTASDVIPFYEQGGSDNRTADSTTMFDFPTPALEVVKRQFAAGATKVTSRAHFTTYLVRDMEVLQQVTTDVEWVFADATFTPARTQSQQSAAAASLDPAMRKVLVRQFPDFDYLP